jgi:hypothetical protein
LTRGVLAFHSHLREPAIPDPTRSTTRAERAKGKNVMVSKFELNRRHALAALAAAGLSGCATAAPRASSVLVPLPTADQIRDGFQHMVDFGPRLPGNGNHLRFVDWMAEEFQAAGLQLGPCREYDYRRWDPKTFSLEVEDGGQMQSVSKPAYYVRSKPTGPEGVTGPLVYGGRLAPTGPVDLGDIPPGAIVVFEAALPQPKRNQLGRWEYVHGILEPLDEYMNGVYKRLWLTPAFPLEAVRDKGAAGVVIIMDVSSEMIGGNYSPHSSEYEPPLPALFVGQDVGVKLKAQAQSRQRAKLTLDAEWTTGPIPSLTAVLPGQTDEVMIIDTHTDGQNFIEENGCVVLVMLARHFASLPKNQRLKRTLVFAGWPGHMTGTMPECAGWIRSHKDIVDRAAAAFTIEHLGATEWDDVPGRGYVATGQNEFMNLAATGGVLSDLAIAGIKKHDLKHHGVQYAPGRTVGGVFHEQGVPHVGCISGPSYLLGVVPNGHMDKLDAPLAETQIKMLAELIQTADGISMATLKGEDASLGAKPLVGEDSSRVVQCLTRPA